MPCILLETRKSSKKGKKAEPFVPESGKKGKVPKIKQVVNDEEPPNEASLLQEEDVMIYLYYFTGLHSKV